MTHRILIVDDEPHMLRLLERIITGKTAYQVYTTSNSLEVPELLMQMEFDLIISDLKMPGLDGVDVLRLLKERQRSEEVIIITAFGSMESAMETLSLGVFSYILKPFKKEQIIATVTRAMEWHGEKLEVRRLRQILGQESFEAAVGAFRREYVQRLAERYEGDVNRMADRSGLTVEELAELLNGANDFP